MSNYPTEIIGHIPPLPRIDLHPHPYSEHGGKSYYNEIGLTADQERIWQAVVATAESSNMGTRQ